MAPPKFKDLLKAPSDLLGDDFTSKKAIKFKLPAGGITFTAQNEFKLSGDKVDYVANKITGKYAHKPSKVSIDKLEFKGADRVLELSYPFAGGKVKGVVDQVKGKNNGSVSFDTCVGGASVLAKLAVGGAYKLDLSGVTAMKGLNVGAQVSCHADKMSIEVRARARAGRGGSRLGAMPRARARASSSASRAHGPPFI